MKILAIEKEIEGIKPEQFKPHFKNEASAVWELCKIGIIREIYFTLHGRKAVIILECRDEADAEKILKQLPLVKEGLISFTILPLTAYNGFERLFA
jgi:hypothetical protein